MSKQSEVSTLFLDIGGVLLTNGWDRHARQRTANHFNLYLDEFNERHHLTFDTYEQGKLDLDTYLSRVVFYEDRSFSRDEFKKFMHDQSQPFQDALDFFYELKNRHGLQVVAVSNEGQELTEHRVEKFALRRLFDAFISSCFVHCRKPDEDMYRMALNVSQANPDKTVYIDDRLMFVEVAGSMGIRGIHHIDLRATRSRLADMNLIID